MRSRRWMWTLMGVTLAITVHRMLFAARVAGESMLPTLREGDYLLGVRIPQNRSPLARLLRWILLSRQAIVLARPPAHLGRLEVKRITAVTGDLCSWGWDACHIKLHRIPRDHVFLLGDASRHLGYPPGLAADSRQYGPCPSTAIVARVFLRFWPLARFGASVFKPGY